MVSYCEGFKWSQTIYFSHGKPSFLDIRLKVNENSLLLFFILLKIRVMKRAILFLVVTVFSVISLQSQNECNPYMTLVEGNSWEVETYNAKDKYQGKNAYEVVSVEEDGNTLIATVKFTAFDKKDEEVMSDEMTFECKDGVIKMDMSKHIPKETMESLESMNFEIKTESMSMPEKLEVGQQLDEGSVSMSVDGVIPINIKVEVVDRKVESKGTVSVPAGNFDAFKVSSTIKTTGMIKTESKSVEFIAEGVGVVRTESYNKKGKLDSYTVLSAYSGN